MEQRVLKGSLVRQGYKVHKVSKDRPEQKGLLESKDYKVTRVPPDLALPDCRALPDYKGLLEIQDRRVALLDRQGHKV